MRTEQEIRANIMRRVYAVYFMRQVGQPAIRAIVFLSACLAVATFSSMPHVVANLMGVTSVAGIAGTVSFLLSAFLKTEFYVQSAIVVALCIVLWSAVDLLKNTLRIPAHA